jgi:uncharacterized delta-60 repeat protein
MRTSARSALAVLSGSGLLIAMTAAAAGAQAAAKAGSLDPSFGTGGKVLTHLNGPAGTGNQALVTDVAVEPDGDIVVSGSFGLVRYLPDGKLDTTFGTNGVARTSFAVSALAIQPNGDYLVAGQKRTGPELKQDDFAIARLTTSGHRDPAFGHGGMVLTPFPDAADGAGADAVLVEPSGDILAGGQALVPGSTRNEPVVAQGALALYTPGGALVSSFGSGGLVQAAAINANITTLGTDSSGDIFVLPAHAEFSSAGQLDSAVTAEPITGNSHGGAGAFLPSGQSLIVGVAATGRKPISFKAQVRSFTAAGQPTPGFDSAPFRYDGSASASGQDAANAVAVTPAGQIIVAGSERTTSSISFGVERLNASGMPDTSFGDGGGVTTSFEGDDVAEAVVVQPNGDIVAAGFSEDDSTGDVDVALARYLG